MTTMFTMDCSAKPTWMPAQAPTVAHDLRSAKQLDLSDQCTYMHPNSEHVAAQLQHYTNCKMQKPHTTSAIMVLTEHTKAKHQSQLKKLAGSADVQEGHSGNSKILGETEPSHHQK
jgi:hypothetical protein